MTPQRKLLIILVAVSLIIGFSSNYDISALAQTETNTTTTTTTTITTTTTTTITNTTTTTTTEYVITIVNVTFTERPEGLVNVFFYNDSYIELVYSCYHLTQACPILRYEIIWDNVTRYNGTIEPSQLICDQDTGVCRLFALFQVGNASIVTVSYTYIYSNQSSKAYEIVLRNPRIGSYPEVIQYILSMLPFAIFAALAVRGDMMMAGIGMIVSVLVIYIANIYGLVPNVGPVLPIAATAGAVILWTSSRR